MSEKLQELHEKYHALKETYHKALHKLTEAAQMIKSYEYLEKRQKQETELLKKIAENAHELCDVNNFSAFREKRKQLMRKIHEYKRFKSDASADVVLSDLEFPSE